jgi:hypothetical protein
VLVYSPNTPRKIEQADDTMRKKKKEKKNQPLDHSAYKHPMLDNGREEKGKET